MASPTRNEPPTRWRAATVDHQPRRDPDSLQSYLVGDMTVTEEIQVSWLTDGGDLERTFSFITDPARSVLTQWQPFSDAPEDGSWCVSPS